MRKVLSLILCGVMVFTVTGCGDSSSDSEKKETQKDKDSTVIKEEKEIALECSGDYLFNFGFVVGRMGNTAGGDYAEEIKSYYFDDASGIGNGEYKFVFENEQIVKMSSVETMNLTYSNQISDTAIKEEDDSMEDCTISRNNNGNIVIKCEFNNEDDYVVALNLDSKTPDDLEKILEEKTQLICK